MEPFLYSYISKEETYGDGSAIIEEGSRGNSVYLVLEGRAKVRKKTRNGVLTLGTLEAGAVFGEMAFLEREVGIRSATVVAADGPIKLGLLNIQLLEKDYERLSPELKEILKTLMTRIKSSTEKACMIASGSLKEPKEDKETKIISLRAEAERRKLVKSLSSESRDIRRIASNSQNKRLEEKNFSRSEAKRDDKPLGKTREKDLFEKKPNQLWRISKVALALAISVGFSAVIINHYGEVESKEVLTPSNPTKPNDIKIYDKKEFFSKNAIKLTNPISFQMAKPEVQKGIFISQDNQKNEGSLGVGVLRSYAGSDNPLQTGEAITRKEALGIEISSRLSASDRIREPFETGLSKFDKAISSFPYSIYLGSYKTRERAERAVSSYQEKGLSPYWVKLDLGAKGTWFRVFAGYFQRREYAEMFIREKNLVDAKPKHTKYANLIGISETHKEIDTKKYALLSLGYCPYVIRGANGKFLLYAGAFYQKRRAEEAQRDLASQGIKSQLIER